MSNDKNKAGLAARKAALALVQKVIHQQKPLDSLLETDPLFTNLVGRDRSFAHAITATSLRHYGEITTVIKGFLTKPLPKSSGATSDLLLITAAQLLFMRVSPHAAIDSAVTLAKQDQQAQHFSGLVNAVLRKVATQGERALAQLDGARLNTPAWLWQQWLADYGPETTRAIAQSHQQQAALDLTVKQDPAFWAEKLQAELLSTGSLRLSADDLSVADLPGFAEGAWWVQDAAAALPAKLLGDNLTGKTILDLCAAPGGKTAQLLSAGATVTAVDDSAPRLKRLRENLERLQLSADVIQVDVLRLPETPLYDGVLLDAPCTATGTIRRHPDLIFLKSAQQQTELTHLQAAMLNHAAKIVKPGGQLIYCVCSLAKAEGEEQISKFLQRHSDFELQPISPQELQNEEKLLTSEGFIRCLPFMTLGQTSGLDGFFAARLQRRL